MAIGTIGGVAAIGGCGEPAGSAGAAVQINTAASISHVIEALAEAIESDLGVALTINTGGSGILAQQIVRGDRADLFISADTQWMDHLEQKGLIESGTRVDLAGNRLVLVGHAGSGLQPGSLADLTQARYQPIAIGDPSYVPAGRYAMQAFESSGITHGEGTEGNPGGESRGGLTFAEASNVRAALAFVLTGQCPVGLVYASDAQAADDLELLLRIDPKDHNPIRYPAAVVRDAPNREQAMRVLDWLQGERAQSAFRDAGFEPAR